MPALPNIAYAKEMPQAESRPLADRLTGSRKRLAEGVHRLASLADSLCGPLPEGTSPDPYRPEGGFLDLVENSALNMHLVAEQIETICSHIERRILDT